MMSNFAKRLLLPSFLKLKKGLQKELRYEHCYVCSGMFGKNWNFLNSRWSNVLSETD